MKVLWSQRSPFVFVASFQLEYCLTNELAFLLKTAFPNEIPNRSVQQLAVTVARGVETLDVRRYMRLYNFTVF